ncbi:Crp/Fnr family transcriptional regulator [uncultured Kriegella sp.]|uniref:Crp/Fnr family transcriptional regulator n=1 Tax=uncultured Kriegella sp. TaxID=1798910 RepID=UPI0030D8AC6A
MYFFTMTHETLDYAINKYSPNLSLDARSDLARLGQEVFLEKGACLFSRNAFDDYEYILLKGIARTYLPNMEGTEITLSFFEEGMVLPPYVTRTNNQRSLLFCDAITDCRLVRLGATEFERLMIDNLEIRNFGNSVLRVELQNKVLKEIRMASWSAKERLQQFRKDFTMLENYVPHSMVASYLGITNVTLSRLRKEG